MIACKKGLASDVRTLLVGKGSKQDVFVTDHVGNSALAFASQSGSTECGRQRKIGSYGVRICPPCSMFELSHARASARVEGIAVRPPARGPVE